MKIIKIIHGYPPDYNAGSEVYSKLICDELSKENEVFVFTREENDYLPDFNFRHTFKENIHFTFVNMPRAKDGYNHLILNKLFANFLNIIKPDIAHVGHLNHLSTGIIFVLKELNIPIVFTLHDFWLMCPRGQFLQRNFNGLYSYQLCEKQDNIQCALNCYSMYFSTDYLNSENDLISEVEKENTEIDLKYWGNWIENRMKTTMEIVKKVDLFIAPSNYLRNRFINDFSISPDKIIYLDYGFSTSYLKPISIPNREYYTFGYIGTHIPSKGINLLIEAFKQLEGKCKLKIFGRENGQNTLALKKSAAECKMPIEFCGEYDNRNICTDVFEFLDCIVVPSIWTENSPLVIHEAQACRIPVITANTGGMAEYVEHHKNGLLFKHRDVNSLCNEMQWAMDNAVHMKKYGEKAYLFSNNGDVPKIEEHCKELLDIYEIQLNRLCLE